MKKSCEIQYNIRTNAMNSTTCFSTYYKRAFQWLFVGSLGSISGGGSEPALPVKLSAWVCKHHAEFCMKHEWFTNLVDPMNPIPDSEVLGPANVAEKSVYEQHTNLMNTNYDASFDLLLLSPPAHWKTYAEGELNLPCRFLGQRMPPFEPPEYQTSTLWRIDVLDGDKPRNVLFEDVCNLSSAVAMLKKNCEQDLISGPLANLYEKS